MTLLKNSWVIGGLNGGSQETETECEDQPYLATSGKLETPDVWHWEEHDHKVCNHVQRSGDNKGRVTVPTGTSARAHGVVVVFHRLA